MTAPRDKFGRPIVVVTGMGVVTSLGAGKADNWTKLTAGESGIRTITRFPIDGLKTTMAGTVDFVTVEPFSVDRPHRTAGRNRHRRSARAVRHRQQGRFSRDRCFSRSRRSRSNGRSGWSSAARSARPNSTYDDLLRVSGGGKYTPLSTGASCSARSPDHLAENVRHQGFADFAVDRLRLRRHRDPARRRSHPPRRSRRRAVRRDRRLGQSGSPGAVLAAVGAVDPERSAAGRLKAVLEEPRRFRDGRRRRRAGAGKLRSRDGARRRRSSASSPAAAN